MTWARRTAPAASVRERVETILAAHGLGAGRRAANSEVSWGQRFGAAMGQLGGGFALLGAHLANRPDVIGLANALDLEEADLEALDSEALDLPASYPAPLAPEGADPVERIGQILGRPALETFTEIAPKPFSRGPLEDHYRGLLRRFAEPARQQSQDSPPGDQIDIPVVLSLVRPDAAEAVRGDLDLLDLLKPAFAGLLDSPVGRRQLEQVMAEFCRWVSERLDLRRQALGLEHFAVDLVDADLIAVPEVFSELCAPELAVRSWLGERPINSLESPDSAVRQRELGRQLNLAVLEQALVAGHVPVAASWHLERRGRLALVGGVFERLPAASLPRLWAYLRHLAGHRPEEAFEAIEGELRPMLPGADTHALKLKMRQLVPFRDGGWTERRDTLAELLALHWCLVVEHGFSPSPALATLWASLYRMAALGRRLGIEGDPLRAALEDLRWLASFRRLRRLSDPQELGGAMEHNLASLMEMPQKLDRLLQLWSGESGDDLQLHLQVAGDREADQRRQALLTTLCLAALMVAVAMVGDRLPRLGIDEAWVEAVSAVILLALGVCLLSTILRKRRT